MTVACVSRSAPFSSYAAWVKLRDSPKAISISLENRGKGSEGLVNRSGNMGVIARHPSRGKRRINLASIMASAQAGGKWMRLA